MKATTKNIRMSLRKLNMVAAIVRGAPVETALARLRFTPKKGARVLYKVIASAAANAEHKDGKSRRNLLVSSIVVQKGTTLKRGLPVSRGRWHAIYKRMCHVSVVLVEKEGAATEKPAKQKRGAAPEVAPAAAKTSPASTKQSPDTVSKAKPKKLKS